MNIAIGYHLQSGPLGGGNQFAKSLVTALEIKGHTVNFDLSQIDLDLILLTETRVEALQDLSMPVIFCVI